MKRDRVTWAGYLSLALFTFFLNIQGNILPFLRDEFHLSYRLVTLHPAALAVGLILCGFVGERFTAALGRRNTLGLGLSGLVVGSLLVIAAPSAVVSIAGCLVMGTVGGLILTTVPGMLIAWHQGNGPIALGEANGVSYAASFLAALSMGFFVFVGLDWRASLFLGVVLAALLVSTCGRRSLPEAPARAAGASGRLPAAYWLHWLALIGFVGLEQSTLVWAPEFMESVKGLTRSGAATAAGVFSAGMLIGRMSAAPLLSRVGAMPVLAISLALALASFALYWAATPVGPFLAGLFGLGLGTALLYPLTLALAIGLSGPLGDTASARASLASGLAILLVPLVVGALADRVGLAPALVVLPALGLLSLACLVAGRALQRSSVGAAAAPAPVPR